MNETTNHAESMVIASGVVSSGGPVPLPKIGITIRPGVMSDVPFLDSLQKLHTKQVGWMPTKQFEGKIRLGHVLVAEERVEGGTWQVGCGKNAGEVSQAEPQATSYSPQAKSVGYCIGNDQYFKRDDVGIIYQMNVLPGRQRGLIGATLLKALFERSAYGCKLYCCWCAQDIAANKFWEAMGFVPLAFRAGSEKKSRVHIFWQKRIRQGDTTTPWWFPSKTAGGSIREDRIVLPIPPGTHWSDAKPLILPSEEGSGVGVQGSRQIEVGRSGLPSLLNPEPRTLNPKRIKAAKKVAAVETSAPIRRNGLMFDIPKQGEPLPEAKAVKDAKAQAAGPEQSRRATKVKRTCDPRLVSAARELRDRWLEEVNAGNARIGESGKYEVGRRIDCTPTQRPALLEAA